MTLQTRDESLRFTSVKRFATALVGALILSWATPAGWTIAAPAGDDQVVAYVARGVGHGHGRGMSQWGAYGRALGGQTWEQILDAYYGGTVPGVSTEPSIRVRLTEWDDATIVGVISRSGTARWNTSTSELHVALRQGHGKQPVLGVGCHRRVRLSGRARSGVPFADLQIGSEGEAVRQVQEFLAFFGYAPGPSTETTVR